MKIRTSSTRGFTLIELSIVLVIIGMIAGGILVGQDLIHQARLRKIITESEEIKTAVNLYKIKYNAFPGDHNRAQQIFGATDCPNHSSSQTCNGNGNGKIDSGAGVYETWRAIQHLNLAGLVKGSYTGRWNDPPEDLWLKASYQDTYWRINNGSFYGNTGNKLSLSSISPTSSHTERGALVLIDAWSIDIKIDDGLPHKGKLNGDKIAGPPPDCVTMSGGYVYRVDDPNITCVMRFLF